MNIFKQAVEQCPDIKNGYCVGLKALNSNSPKLKVGDKKNLLGSVDIDTCTKKQYPNDSRWDYAIGYAGKALFVEVHPANTSNVKEMFKKVMWLEEWLNENGKPLAKIRKDRILYWIPSGKVAILKTSPQYRSLAKHNLLLTKSIFVLK